MNDPQQSRSKFDLTLEEAIVVKSGAGARPWQVLLVGKTFWYVHASFKTRTSAVMRAKELVPGAMPKVLDTPSAILREYGLLRRKRGSGMFTIE